MALTATSSTFFPSSLAWGTSYSQMDHVLFLCLLCVCALAFMLCVVCGVKIDAPPTRPTLHATPPTYHVRL